MTASATEHVHVFVSYRRGDRPGHAGRLQDALRSRFGRDRVFYDVTAVPGGADFTSAITDAVDRSTVVIAIIGPDWQRRRPLDRLLRRPDWVRFELEYARRANTPILPVLVDRASMPSFAPGLAFLRTINAVSVRDESWDRDVEDLLAQIPNVRAAAGQVAVPESPHPWRAIAAVALLAALLAAGWLTYRLLRTETPEAPQAGGTAPPAQTDPAQTPPVPSQPGTGPPTGRGSEPRSTPAAANRPPTTGSIEVDQFNAVGLVSATVFTLRAKDIVDPDGDPLQYRWDFGDGSQAPPSKPEVTKVYDRVNRFTVRLFVTDGRSPEVEAAETRIIVRDLTGTWHLSLKPDPAASYVVPTSFQVELLQQGNQLSGRITPAGSNRPTVLSGSVDHPLRVYFGSESAWWNDQSDAYFDMTVTDGFLMIQMQNRDPKRCSPQVPCLAAFMRKQ